jgi:hypothetical protein
VAVSLAVVSGLMFDRSINSWQTPPGFGHRGTAADAWPAVAISSGLLYAVDAAAVHYSHGHTRRAITSAIVRVGLPVTLGSLLGGGFALATPTHCEDTCYFDRGTMFGGGFVVGAFVGGLAAIVFDYASAFDAPVQSASLTRTPGSSVPRRWTAVEW